MEINFYNFKKLMNLTTQLDINLESIRVKSSAVSTVVEDGEIFEANLDEKKDPRVNFLYDTTINVLIPDPESTITNPKPPKNSIRIKGTEVTDLYDTDGNELIKYPINGSLATLEVDNLATPATPPTIPIKIKPAHEFMQDSDPATSRSVLYDRIWLAACGFWNNKNNKLSNFVKKISQVSILVDPPVHGNNISDSFGLPNPTIIRDNSDAPWITIKNFKKRLKDVRDKLVPKGLDVIVTIYEKTLDENGVDINETFLSRKKQKKYSEIITSANNFIIKRGLTPLPSEEISPFDVSIQYVQNIISDDSESLFEELIAIMNEIWDSSLDDNAIEPSTDFINADTANNLIPGKITQLKQLNITSFSTENQRKYISNIKNLYAIQERIRWFEFFNGISINNSLNSVITGFAITKYFTYKKLARILIPIDMGIKVKKIRKKNFNKLLKYPRRYKHIRTDMGIRFAEIKFVNTSILQKYRKNEDVSGTPQVDKNGNPILVENIETGAQEQLIDYAATKPDPLPTDVVVKYEIPHLPFDIELRKMALEQFGFFDHSINANTDNIYDTNGSIIFDVEKNVVNKDIFDAHGTLLIKENTPIPSGYEMFLKTSKNISDMRGGLDIYNKVQFLMTLLQDSFGIHRVKLIETNRSVEDQDKLQLGGASSNFLSWHNYGLSVKILITDDSDTNTIKDGSPDFMKLLDIAESFTSACYNGYLGKPINVVWCGRLKTGPDNFVWEFLPIGVEHKDSWKLRDAAYNQIEPIVANAYVDVKNANFIIPNTTTSGPYVKDNSVALSNAIKISNGLWISPSDIRNFDIPSNLVLKDIQEFLFLIKEKFVGNGADLTGTKNLYEWKLNNPISYKQLILYHSLIGNYNIVRAILAMDYVERFEAFILSASNNPVDFVKNFLGATSYKNIKINLTLSSDHAYISPSDGKLYVVLTDIQSTQPEGNGNTFGQKQIDKEHIKFTTIEPPIVSEKILTDDQILFIHGMLKDQVLSEFKIIKDSFLNLKTDFLHDSVKTGSNAEDFHQLENEFGIIITQDLIPFDQLRGMFNRIAINKSSLNSPDLDGKVRGAGQNIEGNTDDQNQSIFEKLVSNAQTGGVQFVKPGKEKVIIEEIVDEPLERTIRKVTGTDQLDVSDIL